MFDQRRPRVEIVLRLTGVLLTWGFMVVAHPAGAHEVPAGSAIVTPQGETAASTRTAAPTVEPRTDAVELRRTLIRAKKLRIAKRAREIRRAKELARIAAKRRAALRRAQQVAAAKAKARFIATHRCPVDPNGRRWLRGDWQPRPWARPVDGPGAEKRGHYGIDLFARMGTPVRAPFDGYVRYGRSPRGGLWFKLVGREGYVYGSHMSAFAQRGGYVRAADVIGYVGRTGNARGTHPHLHFQWHPRGGRAVNPAGFLWSRCGPPSTSYPS